MVGRLRSATHYKLGGSLNESRGGWWNFGKEGLSAQGAHNLRGNNYAWISKFIVSLCLFLRECSNLWIIFALVQLLPSKLSSPPRNHPISTWYQDTVIIIQSVPPLPLRHCHPAALKRTLCKAQAVGCFGWSDTTWMALAKIIFQLRTSVWCANPRNIPS